jgi:hypothetical protein
MVLFRSRIKDELETLITEAIIDEDLDIAQHPNARALSSHLNSKSSRQYFISLLIDLKKNISGSTSGKVTELYLYFGLNKDSVKKFNSNKWHKKAKGIYELSVMDQSAYINEIRKCTNSRNEYVRMEAQTALIGFLGFDGLDFLDTLTQPLNEWQQIKLLEKLHAFQTRYLGQIERWLKSTNDYVVIFALKLTAVFQQYQYHDEVAACLAHPNEKLRRQTIKTLGVIANADTPKILEDSYGNETDSNKRTILSQLKNLATEDNLLFLIQELENPEDFIKVEAAKVIARLSGNAIRLVEMYAEESPIKYEGIYKHIKSGTY